MSKRLTKFFSMLLSIAMVLSVTTFSGAAEYVGIENVEVRAVTGKWKKDYVGKLEVKFNADVTETGDNDCILTVGSNREADNLKSVSRSEAEINISGGVVTVTFNLNLNLDHAATYYFEIQDGAFKDENGNTTAEYTFSENGNIIIETLEKDVVPITPIQKLIVMIEEWEYGKYFSAVVAILRWFDSL